MITYDDLISRADSAWFAEWIDGSVIRVVQSLRGDILPTRVARQVFLELLDPRELFKNPKTRARLVELMRPAEARELATLLELDGEPYVALSSVSLASSNRRFELLCAFFAIPEQDGSSGTAITPAVSPIQASYGLFPHQQTATESIVRLLDRRPRRAVLHMPTGAGKTRMAMHVICRYLSSNPRSIVVWLANSEELCEQAAEEFADAWSSLGNRDLNVYRYWGSRSVEGKSIIDGLLVAGFAKLYSIAKQDPTLVGELGDRACLLVVDEAHQAIAPTYRLVIDGLSARQEMMPVLGLTATPGRTWNDPEADMQLADFFARNKVSLEIPGYANPIEYLVSEGYLAAPNFRQLEHVSDRLTRQDLEALAADLDVPKEILRKLAGDELRTLKIVREIEDLARSHARILVFATTVEHAISLAAILRARGLDSQSITAETRPDKRSRAIEWYKTPSNEPRVLTNFGVLTTGFDAPQTSAAIIARPTKSLVLYSQMVGRAIRGPKAGGNQSAEIVTVVDTSLPGFGNLAAAFNNWEDVW